MKCDLNPINFNLNSINQKVESILEYFQSVKCIGRYNEHVIIENKNDHILFAPQRQPLVER